MYHIFTKKRFLVDYLENFIDIHNHILPGLDDGAKNIEDSIALIDGFLKFGVTNFVCTPHIMHNYYPNTPETIQNSLHSLTNVLSERGLNNISIIASAEHMIDDNFETILELGTIVPHKKRHLLIEMSYLQPSINFDQAIIKIANHSFFPILAHPERYAFLQQRMRKYSSYKEKGILFQLNLLSLGTFYGKNVPKTAIKLLQDGMIDFVASDVHNLNQLNSLKELTISKKNLQLLLPIINKTINNFY